MLCACLLLSIMYVGCEEVEVVRTRSGKSENMENIKNMEHIYKRFKLDFVYPPLQTCLNVIVYLSIMEQSIGW